MPMKPHTILHHAHETLYNPSSCPWNLIQSFIMPMKPYTILHHAHETLYNPSSCPWNLIQSFIPMQPHDDHPWADKVSYIFNFLRLHSILFLLCFCAATAKFCKKNWNKMRIKLMSVKTYSTTVEMGTKWTSDIII